MTGIGAPAPRHQGARAFGQHVIAPESFVLTDQLPDRLGHPAE